jgi:hypothetical protein
MIPSKTEEPRPWDSMKSLDLYFLYQWDETDPSDSFVRPIPPVTSFLLNLPDRDTLEEDPSELDDALLHRHLHSLRLPPDSFVFRSGIRLPG